MAGTNGHGPGAAVAPAPLYSKDAELAVLGSILIDPTTIWQVADFLKPADFRGELCRTVYGELLSMAEAGTAIDLLTLGQRLTGKDGPPDGWTSWLIGLLNVTPTQMHIVEYARTVEQFATRRRLVGAAEKAAKLAYDDGDFEASLSEAETAVFNVRQGRSLTGVQTAREAAASALARIEERYQQGGVMPGISSGFTDLDRQLGGFVAPFLYILAARPGVGKSALAGNMAAHMAGQGKRVLFFAVEMTTAQVMDRLIAAEARLPLANVRSGRLDASGLAKARAAAHRIGGWRLLIDDTPVITPGQVRAKAMRLYAEHGLDFVIVDHLHEMSADTPKTQRHLELGDMMRALKETAKLVNAPMLVVAQLNRALEARSSKKPTLADLRESGSIEETAYAVMFLYREHQHNETADEHMAELILAKNRDGGAGSIGLYWDGSQARFGNLQREEIRL